MAILGTFMIDNQLVILARPQFPLCQQRTRPWKATHTMFYEAMLADKTPKSKAKQMYRAVMLFGPRWDKNGRLQPINIDGDELYL